MKALQIMKNIKHIRNTKGITQKEMAERLFMDERTYSNFERGIKKSIDVKLLLSISNILKTDINTLISDDITKMPSDEKLQNILCEIQKLKDLFLTEINEMKRTFQSAKEE